MLRSTLLALAIACAMSCPSYSQQPSSQPTAPPASAAGAQPAAPAAGQQAGTEAAKAPGADVPMDAKVITLKGACETKAGAAPPKDCVSSLTREQFEKLTNALQPADRGPVPPEVRRRFATQYAKLLTFADAARALGLENDPKVEQIYTFARNQILGEALNQHFMEEYAHPTDQQIQAYYDQNVSKYLEVTLQRIIIPVPQATADKPKPSDEEQKAYAEKIKARWVAGEDPAKLEKEAMENNGQNTSAPDVNVGARRPGSLPEAHEAVFKLKAGEFSDVYSDPAAFYIYKVVSMRQVPLSEVKSTISQTLQRQMFQDKMKEVQDAVKPELNEAYFGPETPQTVPQHIMRPGMPPMPPGAGAPPARPAAPAAPVPTAPPPPPSPGASHN